MFMALFVNEKQAKEKAWDKMLKESFLTKDTLAAVKKISTGIITTTVNTSAEIEIFRGIIRDHKKGACRNISEIWSPTFGIDYPQKCTLGRCNFLGQTIFYGAFLRDTPIVELNSRPGDYIHIAFTMSGGLWHGERRKTNKG